MAAINSIAGDRLVEFESDIVRLLDHEFEGLRGTAIAALIHFWQKDAYLPIALRMLAEDPSEFPRKDAAWALASFARYTGRSRDKIFRALARAVQSDPDPFVVRAAYVGLVENLAPDRNPLDVPDPIVKERDVDWKLIQLYLPN